MSTDFCTMAMRWLLFYPLAAGLPMLAEAQRTATNPAIEVTTRLVVVSVVVTEKTGRPVTNLSKDDFTVPEKQSAANN